MIIISLVSYLLYLKLQISDQLLILFDSWFHRFNLFYSIQFLKFTYTLISLLKLLLYTLNFVILLLNQLIWQFVLWGCCWWCRIFSCFWCIISWSFFTFKRLDQANLYEYSKQAFFNFFLNFKIQLSLKISIILAASLIKFDTEVLIILVLEFSYESDSPLFLLKFFCSNYDLLPDFVFYGAGVHLI